MREPAGPDASYRVLHAIVGHQFPVYFCNAIRSVLAMTPSGDDILVVDNDSKSRVLLDALQSISSQEPRVSLMLRDSNDMSRNTKVGGLYDAYNEVASYALSEGYDYLHIIQNDMQMLWWDHSVLSCARDIYAEYPECVNIYTGILSGYIHLSKDLEYVKPKLAHLRNYGLIDTGLYDLARWRAREMRFAHAEQVHAQMYRELGMRVFCHPLPTVAAIPWPALVRNGRIIGKEVQPRQQFLLRPLSADEILQVKESTELARLESIAIPWGWTCRTPYWLTDLRSIDYWKCRYIEIRECGVLAARSRWERRGLPLGASVFSVQRRPRFWRWHTAILPPLHGLRRIIWSPR